jgi:hypothetical protein
VWAPSGPAWNATGVPGSSALAALIAQHGLAGDDVHPLLETIVEVVGAAPIAGLDLEHARTDHAPAERLGQIVIGALEPAASTQQLGLAPGDVDLREHAGMIPRAPAGSSRGGL